MLRILFQRDSWKSDAVPEVVYIGSKTSELEAAAEKAIGKAKKAGKMVRLTEAHGLMERNVRQFDPKTAEAPKAVPPIVEEKVS